MIFRRVCRGKTVFLSRKFLSGFSPRCPFIPSDWSFVSKTVKGSLRPNPD